MHACTMPLISSLLVIKASRELDLRIYANCYRLALGKVRQRCVRLKEYVCVEVGHHKNIAEAIEDMQKNGWSLHTYQATGQATLVSHYLLFERGE